MAAIKRLSAHLSGVLTSGQLSCSVQPQTRAEPTVSGDRSFFLPISCRTHTRVLSGAQTKVPLHLHMVPELSHPKLKSVPHPLQLSGTHILEHVAPDGADLPGFSEADRTGTSGWS